MTPERESGEPAELEYHLLGSSVDEVLDFLDHASSQEYREDGNSFRLARQRFETGDLHHCCDRMLCISDPKLIARCLYEFEREDMDAATEVMAMFEEAAQGRIETAERYNEMQVFLDRLRDSGDSDGGAGDREPLVPRDPRDGGAIALEPPREEDVDAVARPSTAHV